MSQVWRRSDDEDGGVPDDKPGNVAVHQHKKEDSPARMNGSQGLDPKRSRAKTTPMMMDGGVPDDKPRNDAVHETMREDSTAKMNGNKGPDPKLSRAMDTFQMMMKGEGKVAPMIKRRIKKARRGGGGGGAPATQNKGTIYQYLVTRSQKCHGLGQG